MPHIIILDLEGLFDELLEAADHTLVWAIRKHFKLGPKDRLPNVADVTDADRLAVQALVEAALAERSAGDTQH